jgi:hypothetical protein
MAAIFIEINSILCFKVEQVARLIEQFQGSRS